MSFHEILIAVMAAFAVAGAIDRIFGNRWGLGKEFEEGILAMGSLALAMVGIVCLAPVLANLLKPVIVPVFAFLGADPAMFAGTILACDMGGGALAVDREGFARMVTEHILAEPLITLMPGEVTAIPDGDVVIAAGNNKLYGLLCDVMKQPELKADPRFVEIKDRVANHTAMREIICAWTKDYTIDEIDKMLNDAGCPACPVNTIDRLVTDPQIAGAREMFPEIDQPGIGKLKITAVPQHLTRTKAYPRKAAPLLGEDNAKIYGELLGLDAAKLEELKAKGAI